MGRNGAQKTDEANEHATALGAIGATYEFAPGTVNNLRADDFIKDHGDVAGIQVAYAILNAAGAVEAGDAQCSCERSCRCSSRGPSGVPRI